MYKRVLLTKKSDSDFDSIFKGSFGTILLQKTVCCVHMPLVSIDTQYSLYRPY